MELPLGREFRRWHKPGQGAILPCLGLPLEAGVQGRPVVLPVSAPGGHHFDHRDLRPERALVLGLGSSGGSGGCGGGGGGGRLDALKQAHRGEDEEDGDGGAQGDVQQHDRTPG